MYILFVFVLISNFLKLILQKNFSHIQCILYPLHKECFVTFVLVLWVSGNPDTSFIIFIQLNYV